MKDLTPSTPLERLRKDDHQVLYVLEMQPGIPDDAVLAQAVKEIALLVTADKDFGELVFRQHLMSAGVLLLRLHGLSPTTRPISSRPCSVNEDSNSSMRLR
jgi:predicted nuclease of predicted toxin-antitoxin system